MGVFVEIMYLSTIELSHYRNYKKEKINLDKNINIFIGNNAQGKTNLLESIYILALTKSHRVGFENNIIQNGYIACNIKGKLYDNKTIKDLKITINNENKKVFINNKNIKKIASYISNMNVIMFCPNDLDIIKGSPQNRRNLLNIEISQLYPSYINYLNEYNKILKNRNEYLKQMNINGMTDKRYLEILNNKLVERGTDIYLYRKKYLDYINNKIKDIYKNIMNIDNLNIIYEPNIDIKDYEKKQIEKEFLKKLNNNFQREIFQGMTLYGPHRDDFSFYIDDQDIKYYGSQGQQRVAIISFKLAEVDLFKEEKKTNPILLLDDIFSELDIKKRNNLVKYIPDDIQTIITTTDLKNIQKKIVNNSKIFIVDNGNIVEKAG